LRIVSLVASAIAVLVTTAHAYWLFLDVRVAQERLEIEDSLRRLAALTIRNFPGRDLESGELFWKSINREGNPMKDAWGTDYRYASRDEKGARTFFWTSAGPDGELGTRDDLSVEVPYPSGPGQLPELAPGELPVTPPLSNDAK
jgi:hypothetical protein